MRGVRCRPWRVRSQEQLADSRQLLACEMQRCTSPPRMNDRQGGLTGWCGTIKAILQTQWLSLLGQREATFISDESEQRSYNTLYVTCTVCTSFPIQKENNLLRPAGIEPASPSLTSLVTPAPGPRASTTFEWRTTSARAEQRSTRRLGMIGALPLSYRRDISLGMACCLMGTAVAASS